MSVNFFSLQYVKANFFVLNLLPFVLLVQTGDLCECVQSDQAEMGQALRLEEAPQSAVEGAALTIEMEEDPW